MTRLLGCFYVILTIAGGILITDLRIKLPFLAACGAMQLIVFIVDRKAAIKRGADDAIRGLAGFMSRRPSGSDRS